MPGTTSYTAQQIREVLAYTDPRNPKPTYDEIAREMQHRYGPNRKGTWKASSIKYIIDNYSMREEYQFFPWQTTYQSSQLSNPKPTTAHSSYGRSQRVAVNTGQRHSPSHISRGHSKTKVDYPGQQHCLQAAQNNPQGLTPSLPAISSPNLSSALARSAIVDSPFSQKGNSIRYDQTTSHINTSRYPDHAQQVRILYDQHSKKPINCHLVGGETHMGIEDSLDRKHRPRILKAHQDGHIQGHQQQSVPYQQLPNVQTSQSAYRTDYLQNFDPLVGDMIDNIHPPRHVPQVPPNHARTFQGKHHPQLYSTVEYGDYSQGHQCTQYYQRGDEQVSYSPDHSLNSQNSLGYGTSDISKDHSTSTPYSGQINNSSNNTIFLRHNSASVADDSHHQTHIQGEPTPSSRQMHSPGRSGEELNLDMEWIKRNIGEALRSARDAMSQGVEIDKKTSNFVAWILMAFGDIGANEIPYITKEALQRFRLITEYQRICSERSQTTSVPCGELMKVQCLQGPESSYGRQPQHQNMLHDFSGGYRSSPFHMADSQPLFQNSFPEFDNVYNDELEGSSQNSHEGMENYAGDTNIQLPTIESTMETFMSVPGNIREQVTESHWGHQHDIKRTPSVHEPGATKQRAVSKLLREPIGKFQEVTTDTYMSARYVPNEMQQQQTTTDSRAAYDPPFHHHHHHHQQVFAKASDGDRGNQDPHQEKLVPGLVIDGSSPPYTTSLLLKTLENQTTQEPDVSRPKAEVASKKRKFEEGLTKEHATKRQVHGIAPAEIRKIEEAAGVQTQNLISGETTVPVLSISLELEGLMAVSKEANHGNSGVANPSSVSARFQDALEQVVAEKMTPPPVASTLTQAPGMATDSVSSSSPTLPVSQPVSRQASPVSGRPHDEDELHFEIVGTEMGETSPVEQITDWSEFNSIAGLPKVEKKKEVYHNAPERYPDGFTLPEGAHRIVNGDGTFGYTTLAPPDA